MHRLPARPAGADCTACRPASPCRWQRGTDRLHDDAPGSRRESLPLASGVSRGRPLVIAHRGDSFHAPENTLEAARLALGGRRRRLGVRRPVDPRRRAGRPPRRVAAADDRRRHAVRGRPPRPRRLPHLGLRLRRGPDPRRRLLVRRRQRRSPLGPRLRDPRSARSGRHRALPLRLGPHPDPGRGPDLHQGAGLAGERRDQVVPRPAARPGRAGARGHRGDRDGRSRLDLLVRS